MFVRLCACIGPPASKADLLSASFVVTAEKPYPYCVAKTVIAGLDPAIHLLAKKMDPRVKPAGDVQSGVVVGFRQLMTQ